MITAIGLDADDTLWHNESLYHEVQQQYIDLLAPYAGADEVSDRLYANELANLNIYGYGIKAFTLSMIETAIELSDGRIPAGEIARITGFARSMIANQTQLLEGAAEAVSALAERWPLMLVTKGDPLDQEAKLERSGLAAHFQAVEILSRKDEMSYAALLARHRIAPGGFMMVGNSLKSDVLPVVALGGVGVYIPYHLTWAHENDIDLDANSHPYYELESLAELPALVERLEAKRT